MDYNIEQNVIHDSWQGGICAPESEMSTLIHKFDWSISLGPISQWPSVLRFSLSLILNSQQPTWIGWGEDLFFYNDAYIPILGKKHPMALGKPSKEEWDDLWKCVVPWLEKAKRLEPIFISNYRYFSMPFDYLKEDFCSFSYNPMLDESNQFRGIICPITITTDKLLGERRSKTISNLSKSLIERSEDAACSSSIKILSENRDDVPFALIYLIKNDVTGMIAILQNSYGIEGIFNHINPSVINLDNDQCFWPITKVLEKKRLKVISVKELTDLPLGLASQPISSTIIQPLFSNGSEKILGVLITGVNPCCKLDKSFRRFFELVAGQINTSILNAQHYEDEKQQKEMLSEIDRVKTLFFTNVSHELRTPLSLILSPLEDMLSDPNSLTDCQFKQLDLVHRNSLRLLKLVNSLLDFSRIEAKRMQAVFEPTNLSLLTSNLASVFRSIIEKANLEFSVETCNFSEKEIVYIDHEMWEKIIFNLLSNAFKFTLKGRIKVSLNKKNGCAITKIKDTGVGIPESELPRIFERFKRVEGTHSRSFEGTGIGLALTNELVKYLGGQLNVKSKLGKGSTFTVSIPLGRDHLPPDRHVAKRNLHDTGRMSDFTAVSRWISDFTTDVYPDSSPKSDVEGRSIDGIIDHEYLSSIPATPPKDNISSMKALILVADDNADMREYLKYLLEKEDYCKEVITVKNGKIAYNTALKINPDIIVCDVMMPKLDGFGLLKALKGNSQTLLVPFIMLSARAGEEAKIQGLQAGADDYLVKPFSSKELVARIEAHLKITKIRKESFQREKELIIEAQSAKNNLENILQNLKEGFFVMNDQWEITYLNETMSTMLHKRKVDLVGKNFFEVIPESQELMNDIIFAKKEKVPVINECYFPSCKRWYENRILPHLADGICIFSSDISTRRQLEIEKKNAVELANKHQQQRIIEADEYRHKQAEFIDTLCHELRNPLNGIYGGVFLLSSDVKELNEHVNSLSSLSKKNCRLVNRIHQSVRKLEETLTAVDQCAKQQKVIVDDVLDLSKLDNNKVELNLVPFSPTDIIKSSLQMFHPQLSQKSINVTTNIAPEMRVIADPFRLTQVITNLLSNAIKFTPYKGSIRLEAQVEQNFTHPPVLRVSIADTGIGMNFEEKQKLFNRFAQANNRTTTEFGGSGLGLAICKTLVEAMGGTIDVTSEKGKGSTFIFTIRCDIVSRNNDLRYQSQCKKKDSYSPKLRRNPSDVSILIVDDNVLNQKIICRFLEQKGFKFSVANNGQEAVNLFQSKDFDLIFMDIEMPFLNGLQATKQIRSIELLKGTKQSIPVIGVSGNVSDKHVQCAIDSGMNDYLKKPYTRDQVFRTIDQYVLSSPIHC